MAGERDVLSIGLKSQTFFRGLQTTTNYTQQCSRRSRSMIKKKEYNRQRDTAVCDTLVAVKHYNTL